MLQLVIVLIFCAVLGSNGDENNVCPTFEDYYTVKTNSNCWYDVAANSSVVEIITKHGYPIETHKVSTADGYILTMFRIPNQYANRPSSKPISLLLLHGWLNSAAVYVAQGKDSLAFVLADAGYDVWLGNFRGNEYSEEHVNLTVLDEQYWNYSIDELGLYDVPAFLQHIVDRTDRKNSIVCLGHSLGTTAPLIYASMFPKEARKNIKLFIFLAPYANGFNMKSPVFTTFRPLLNIILGIATSNNFLRVISHATIMKNIGQVCLSSPVVMRLCIGALHLASGPQTQTSPNLIPIIFNQMPAGMSFIVGKHVADLTRNPFGRYNYNSQENLKKYNSNTAPQYDVTKLQIPVFMMYAVNDWLCTKEDTLKLYKNLPSTSRYGIHEIKEPNFNHLDFVFGNNSRTLVVDHILKLLKDFNFN